MRSTLLLTLILLLAGTLATAGTLQDPFHQSQAGCSYTLTTPFSTCDVIGDEMLFDIQKATVTVSTSFIDATVFFNYGGGSSLSSFNVGGADLNVGDLFFYDPSSPQTSHYDSLLTYPEYAYGVPLVNHDGLTAGNLYQVANFNGLQTADSILNQPGMYYRHTQPVWMTTGETLAATGTGVSVTATGADGVSGALYEASIHIPTPAAFPLLIKNNQIGIGFEAATCGNDVLTGLIVVTPTPEPTSLTLMGAGLGLMGFGLWRRKRRLTEPRP
ncbi:MAG TPA: PEP-CTERM sorting domain-containing protein [Bryobacteraceae bacterium]|nr:PEP-CTERM sorting domain-containing protein [Bryobacteraceae bacterium]